jgi:hypothetical protein
MKRGQVTIFIIIAIFIVVAVISLIFLVKTKSSSELDKEFFSQANIKPSLQNIQSFILDCLDETSKDALDVIGVQGGYYTKPEKAYDLQWVFIPYYYHRGEFLMPSKQKIESELNNYIDDQLGDCIANGDFNDFRLDYSSSRTRSMIKPGEVLFEIDMPVQINKEDNVVTLELGDYPVSRNSSLYEILEVAEYITNSHKRDPELYCISCVGEMAEERDLFVDIMRFTEDSMMTVISENHTSSEKYSFVFLNKYTGSEESPEIVVDFDVPGVPGE